MDPIDKRTEGEKKKEIFMTAAKNIKADMFYKVGFFFLIIFLVGFIIGIYFAQDVIIERRLNDSIKLKGIVINSIPYDLKERL